MKLLFKNTTIYNKNVYSKFNQFHIKKFGLKYDLSTLLISIMLLYCIIILFKNKTYFLGILFIFILITYIIWRIFRPVLVFKKETNNRKINRHPKYVYNFYKHYFKVLYQNEYSIFSYFKIRKVFETNNEFYLYLDKNHALPIIKNSFSIGTSEEFSKFIRKKCWYKYKNEIEKKDR